MMILRQLRLRLLFLSCALLFFATGLPCAKAASSATAQYPPADAIGSWIQTLIDDIRALQSAPANTPQHAEKIKAVKSKFAIAEMAQKAYGDAFQNIPAPDQRKFLNLMDQFFEKAVIETVLKSKFADPQNLTYRIFQARSAQDNECASAIMGRIDYDTRVDWTIKSGQKTDRYETRFCLNKGNKNDYQIQDMVIEGISWVEDLADELSQFLNPPKTAGAKEKTLPERHRDLIARIRARIQRLDAPTSGQKKSP